jgi:hypothetical protein
VEESVAPLPPAESVVAEPAEPADPPPEPPDPSCPEPLEPPTPALASLVSLQAAIVTASSRAAPHILVTAPTFSLGMNCG